MITALLARLGMLRNGFSLRLTGSKDEPAQRLGLRGERLAARYLRRHGYRIIERNFRAAGAEIDIIAADGDTVIFVEVKARRTAVAGTAQEAVGERKQQRIRRAAEIYLARSPQPVPARFDVVAINWDGGRARLELLKDAF